MKNKKASTRKRTGPVLLGDVGAAGVSPPAVPACSCGSRGRPHLPAAGADKLLVSNSGSRGKRQWSKGRGVRQPQAWLNAMSVSGRLAVLRPEFDLPANERFICVRLSACDWKRFSADVLCLCFDDGTQFGCLSPALAIPNATASTMGVFSNSTHATTLRSSAATSCLRADPTRVARVAGATQHRL